MDEFDVLDRYVFGVENLDEALVPDFVEGFFNIHEYGRTF